MSRSFRRSPFFSLAAQVYRDGYISEKPWKRRWHKKMRAATLVALSDFDAGEDFLPHYREVGPIWSSGNGGKKRFHPHQHPEWMRK